MARGYTKMGESEFKGKVGSHIVLVIVNFLLFTVTLGLATPWIVCRNIRWKTKNKVIDGCQITFDGKGIQLFGRFIGWGLLTIITLGIFAWWWPSKIARWATSHTHIEGGEDGESKFDCGVETHIGLVILNFFNIVFTLGLGAAWAKCRTYRWRNNHMIINGNRVRFYGKGSQLFGRYIGWSLLTIITLGIFGFWVPVKLQKFITEHTHFEHPHFGKSENVCIAPKQNGGGNGNYRQRLPRTYASQKGITYAIYANPVTRPSMALPVPEYKEEYGAPENKRKKRRE